VTFPAYVHTCDHGRNRTRAVLGGSVRIVMGGMRGLDVRRSGRARPWGGDSKDEDDFDNGASDHSSRALASGRWHGHRRYAVRLHGAATVAAPCDLGFCPFVVTMSAARSRVFPFARDGGATVAPPSDLGLSPIPLNHDAG
jgi:hypothetical protein